MKTGDRSDDLKSARWEWQTLLAIVACYGIWLASTYGFTKVLEAGGLFAAAIMLLVVTSIITAFHTSLQHEVVHGHPTPYGWLNEALIFPSLIFVYPFRRYRELHLKHHVDENLTDPYDDPESYYWAGCDSHKIGFLMAKLLAANNTFVGRIILGPFLGLYGFYKTEWQRIASNEKGIRLAWFLHFTGAIFVWYWITQICGIAFWLYSLLVIYPAVSWILVRSFAEHQASHMVGARSAIVEGQGFFALLFLNNSFHLVHHAQPGVAWYKLPKLYYDRKEIYLAANGGYLFSSYWEVIRRFAFHKKQPVFHPILRTGADITGKDEVST